MKKILEKSFRRLYSLKIADQIFLVDDGSTDNSSEIALNIEKYDNVTYFLNKSNNGKGSALTLVKEDVETSCSYSRC